MNHTELIWQVIARAFWLENQRKDLELRALKKELEGVYRALTASENRNIELEKGHEALAARVIEEGQHGA